MGTTLKKGTKVKIKKTLLEGEILRADTNSDVFGYVVQYTDDGETHERFFDQDLIDVVDEPADETEVSGKGKK